MIRLPPNIGLLKMYPKLLVALLLVFINQYGIAQSVNHVIYDTETGLPSSEVYSGFQGSDGRLWFTSDRGVFSYNGYTFKTFTTNEGLGNNTCFAIFQRKDGTMWFTGYDGSLTIYNGKKFTTHKEISAFVKTNFQNDWIDFCDFGDNKIYFYLTKAKTLFEYHITTKKISPCLWIFDRPQASSISLGHNSYFLFHTGIKVKGKPEYQLSRLFPINSETGVFSRGNKVYRVNLSKSFLKVTDSFDFHSFVQSKNILIGDSGSGDFFISSENGLYLCNFQFPGVIKQTILKNINTHNVIRDHEGNYWAATFNRGIIFIPSIKIKTYADMSIGTERINGILHLNKTLVAGSATGLIYFIEDDNGKQFTIDVKQKVPIEEFYSLKPNYLLGYRAYVNTNGTWRLLDTSSFWAQRVVRYNNYVALFTRQNSIYTFDGQTKINATPHSKFNLIKSLCYAQNRVWVGSITHLSSARFKGDTLTDVIDHSKAFPILAQRINDIQSFRNGVLLSVFGKGLVFFDGIKPVPLMHSNIINQDLINRILVVDSRTVLLLTNNGLIRLFFSHQSFKIISAEVFDVNDGLSSNFINAAVVDNNTLWIATNKGVNYLKLSDLVPNTTAPPVNILGIKTSDSMFRFAPNIELKHFQNSFIVEFEGISFKKSNNFPFYKYCLLKNKNDTVWNYTNERSIQFTNLSPGDYTFLVSARSKNSKWAVCKSMDITIHPYFTQTWWFRILAILIGALGVYLFLRIRIRNVKLKNEQQKKVELLGTRALETELMALRNQMNPHFVFNSLNSIQRFIITNNFADANNYITRFSKLMRTSLSMSKLEFIALDNEIEFIQTYLELEKMRFDELFDYQIIIDENIDEEMTKIPTLLIQPLLENSIKHGFKNMKQGGAIKLHISQYDTEHLQVEVSDNGKGIENLQEVLTEKQSKTSFGLGIVMQRIRLLKERSNDDKISFNIVNINPGVRATLIVPLQ